MTGKSHIGVGICFSVLTGTGLYDIYNLIPKNINTIKAQSDLQMNLESRYMEFVTRIHLLDIPQHNITVMNILFLIAAGILLLIGLLLPDIDSEISTISKLCRKSVLFAWLPRLFKNVRHHYWTHTIYFVALCIVLGCMVPHITLLFYLGFGYFIHLFTDSFGAKGVCYFVPKYRKYPNGGEVKIGHKIKLYHTNQISEYITATIIYIGTMVWFMHRFVL